MTPAWPGSVGRGNMPSAEIVATLIVFTFWDWLYLRLGYADMRANLSPSWLESHFGTVLELLGESGKQLKQFGWIHQIACRQR